MTLSASLKSKLLTLTKSKKITTIELIQGVWGGYGQLLRVRFSGGKINSVVVKRVNTPKPENHPKGWNTNLSHQRKLTSYQVESYWYQHYAQQHQSVDCYLPRCLLTEKRENQQILVLEDLSECGFPVVKTDCSLSEAKVCLTWLAHFHALHLQKKPQGLWPTGSYWHLETRPDELENLADSKLKQAATLLDKRLADCPFQTLIHGDAKLANFCFSTSGEQVAAVDFQYVGKGCAMKDVILFISSAVKPAHCEQLAPLLVDHYFKVLKPLTEFDLESQWRPLYSIAWADFQRFVKGWSPDHWKINNYTEALTKRALNEINQHTT
ncbi:phosphotransferase [Psychromonas hadalis]|uniref:phosphotransferase n=1 Tax=Psychromonas hadalis TaxID=211669 RepID=UPI0003B43A45|nr:phosphotransferase [Psychromonas hadalis]